ncbi:hypothetical protein AABB24_001267 [Solanum stoloniferum]|uniref:Uncharacterized protein n=1 Tax=Solanum stoloniferum TaxID=62892 RepID=A0ABD2VN22_9SOLN
MKFSDMKLQAMNSVRAYFVRSWTREDLMNTGEMTQHAYASLKRVYLTLFFAMWSFTSGSFSHWIWEAGGLFTILSSVASLLCLYFISPLRVACLPPFGTSNTWHWNYLVWIHVYEGKECNLHGQPVLFFSSIFFHLQC